MHAGTHWQRACGHTMHKPVTTRTYMIQSYIHGCVNMLANICLYAYLYICVQDFSIYVIHISTRAYVSIHMSFGTAKCVVLY
jgi:hypothetical protein